MILFTGKINGYSYPGALKKSKSINRKVRKGFYAKYAKRTERKSQTAAVAF